MSDNVERAISLEEKFDLVITGIQKSFAECKEKDGKFRDVIEFKVKTLNRRGVLILCDENELQDVHTAPDVKLAKEIFFRKFEENFLQNQSLQIDTKACGYKIDTKAGDDSKDHQKPSVEGEGGNFMKKKNPRKQTDETRSVIRPVPIELLKKRISKRGRRSRAKLEPKRTWHTIVPTKIPPNEDNRPTLVANNPFADENGPSPSLGYSQLSQMDLNGCDIKPDAIIQNSQSVVPKYLQNKPIYTRCDYEPTLRYYKLERDTTVVQVAPNASASMRPYYGGPGFPEHLPSQQSNTNPQFEQTYANQPRILPVHRYIVTQQPEIKYAIHMAPYDQNTEG